MIDVTDIDHHSDGGSRIRPRKHDPDRVIGALATRQHGVVARKQLLETGVGRGAIDRRVAQRRLVPMHHGVYAVGHSHLTQFGRWMAAVLAFGPGAVLSHRSAAALWGIKKGVSLIEVTVIGRRPKPRPSLRVHHARQLDPDERASRQGIPLTALPRTLLDLAEVLNVQGLRHAVEQADRMELLDLTQTSALLSRSHGRHGLKQLCGVLAEYREPADVRSPLEQRFADFCRARELPVPATNVVVAGHTVDAHWPRERLVVEVESLAHHKTRADLERDCIRDEDLKLAGYELLKVTSRRLDRDPGGVEHAIRAMLARGRKGD